MDLAIAFQALALESAGYFNKTDRTAPDISLDSFYYQI